MQRAKRKAFLTRYKGSNQERTLHCLQSWKKAYVVTGKGAGEVEITLRSRPWTVLKSHIRSVYCMLNALGMLRFLLVK